MTMKSRLLKNRILMVLVVIATALFLIGAAAVDNSTAAAVAVMAISGAFLTVFFMANNWGYNL